MNNKNQNTNNKEQVKNSVLDKITTLCKNVMKASVSSYVSAMRQNMSNNYDIKNVTKTNIEKTLKSITADNVVKSMIKSGDIKPDEVKNAINDAKKTLEELMDKKKINKRYKDALYAADPQDDLDIEGSMGFPDTVDDNDTVAPEAINYESWSINPVFNRPELIHHTIRFITTYVEDKEFVTWVTENLDKVRASLTSKSIDSQLPIYKNPANPEELHEAMDIVEDDLNRTVKSVTTMRTPTNITVSISNEVEDVDLTDSNASDLSSIKDRINGTLNAIYRSITQNLDTRATVEMLELYIFKVIHLYLLDKGNDDVDITETDDNIFLLNSISVLSYGDPEVKKTAMFAGLLGLIPEYLFFQLNEAVTDYRKYFRK